MGVVDGTTNAVSKALPSRITANAPQQMDKHSASAVCACEFPQIRQEAVHILCRGVPTAHEPGFGARHDTGVKLPAARVHLLLHGRRQFDEHRVALDGISDRNTG